MSASLIQLFTGEQTQGVKPWFSKTDYAQHFTQQEINDVLTPSDEALQAFEGMTSFQEIENLDDMTYTRIFTFSTYDEAALAQHLLATQSGVFTDRANLIKNKLTEIGAMKFTIQSKIVVE